MGGREEKRELLETRNGRVKRESNTTKYLCRFYRLNCGRGTQKSVLGRRLTPGSSSYVLSIALGVPIYRSFHGSTRSLDTCLRMKGVPW